MDPDRIRFKVRTHDGRFECDARAEWHTLDVAYHLLVVELRRHDGYVIPLDVAAEACGLTRKQLEVQRRIGAIAAQRQRELDERTCPTVWIACGPRRAELPVIEGRLVA